MIRRRTRRAQVLEGFVCKSTATTTTTTTTLVSIVIPTMSSGRGPASPSGGPVIRCGHLKKLKTMKKKYFVLRGEGPGCLACLEYYDSKKKFENRQPPKRSILLHSCFNINKRGDTKHKHVIALYTKDECFCLILDNEKELDEWLKAMLRLQSGDVPDGEQPRPTFGNFGIYTFSPDLLLVTERKTRGMAVQNRSLEWIR